MPSQEDDHKKQIISLKEQLERKNIELNSIQQIGKSLSSELNIDRLLQLIMNEMTRLLNAERSTFFIVDEEKNELWSKIAQKAEVKEIRLKIGQGIAGHVAKTGETINIKDAYNDNRFDSSTDKKTGFKTHSILCMPIFEPLKNKKGKHHIIGVLQVLNKKNDVFQNADEDLLSSLASQVAIAIINARLYTALEKKVSEINLLFDIEKESNKAYDLNDLLQILIKKISNTLEVEGAVIYVLDKEGKIINNIAAADIDTEKILSGKLSAEGGISGNVLQTGKLYFTNEAGSKKVISDEFQKLVNIKVDQYVCAPISIGKKVIGMLELFNKSKENEFFRQEDIELLQSVTGQISRIIESFRLRDQKVKADRLAAIGNMMSTIVHDLRTPINNIAGFSELMQEEEDAETREEYAEIITDQIKTLTNMTKDILDFSKGKTTILPVKTAVDKLINHFVKVFEKDINKKGYHFEYACNVASMIYVDPDKINRIFTNIMKNALEAMEPGGKFSLIANQAGDNVEFLLSDNGKGIPDEIKDKLFESFVTSGKKEGTGLGLAIVKKVVEQHKGRIEVVSEKGKGTTFKIYFKRII